MQIHTNLTQKDYISGYKDMCRFLAGAPVLSAFMLFLALVTTAIPFSLFPLKMGAFGLMATLVVCIVSTQYREGSLVGLMKELKFQQRLFLPAVIGMVVLSWLGFVVANGAMLIVSQPVTETESTMDGAAVMGIVLAASAVFVSQLMPYVIAHFCNGLNLSRKQGEHIWFSLMLRWKTFLAFMPVSLFVPLMLIIESDVSAFIFLAATLYCTFLMFIVFNITPKPKSVTSLNSLAVTPSA